MNSDGSTNKGMIWGIAAVDGVIAFLALKFLAAYTFWPALLLAVLIGVLVAILLWIGFYRDDADMPNEADVSDTLDAQAPQAASALASSVASAPATEAPKVATKPAPSKAASAAKVTGTSMLGDAGAAMVSEKKAEKKTAKAKPDRKPVAKNGKPPVIRKARAGGADDLKQLKGVGPALEKTLNELGFFHFDQVAGWRKKEVEWVDARLKFKGRIERDGWVKQAKTLAKGGSTEFSKRVKKGDVYKG